MAKAINKLSQLYLKSAITQAKKNGGIIKLPDGGGLYFVAEPSRSSWWRFDYRVENKQKSISLGLFHDVSMADARSKRDGLRKQIANGIDPSNARKAEKTASTGGRQL